MKSMLIIGGMSTDNPETTNGNDYAKIFTEGVNNVAAYSAHYDQLSVLISPNFFIVRDKKNGKELKEYDVIAFRGRVQGNIEMAYVVSRYCKLHSIQFFNDYSHYRQLSSKLAQAITFFEHGLPFPRTLYAVDGTSLRKLANTELSFPLIVKDNYGTHGDNNHLVNTMSEFDAAIHNSPTLQFIAQEFIPHAFDYRVLCMGDEQLVIKRRTLPGKHITNTSKGASAELVEPGLLTPEIYIAAKAAARIHNMEVAGVDIIYDEASGQYWVLEVNIHPQLTIGAFTDKKHQLIASYLESLSLS